jgi:N6-adenosine-specific RNA methylase IME4
VGIPESIKVEYGLVRRRGEHWRIVAVHPAEVLERRVTDGSYTVVLADPPWRYEHVRTKSRRVENHYATMPLADICALPVANLAAPDSVLFLWATAPKLPEALRVMDAWGFAYRTQAMWDKCRIGMGYWFRGQHELLLLGTRGKPRTPAFGSRASSVIRSPRGRHSAKPPAARALIEAMFPAARRLELFAREQSPGWDVWGAEAPNSIAWPVEPAA